MDAIPSLDSSSSVINHGKEEYDDWVVVKKQRIVILIPPPSPPRKQIGKQMTPKSVIICSKIAKEKRPGHIKTGNKRQVDASNQLQLPQSSFLTHGVKNVGAVKVVNRQIKAMNLERKLRSLGGIRRWLLLLGLDRFAEIFERKKIGQYQLVDLSASMLKDMGMNAVGSRRKLIHAIDLLSQPYYTPRASNHL